MRVRYSLSLVLLSLVPHVHAADPSQFSAAEQRLFIDDHLRGVSAPATLDYSYSKRGSLEAPADDTARVVIAAARAGAGPSVKVEYLSASRKLELADIDAANANPVILFFLERDIREMHRLTGGSVNYYRKRIRMALADGARVAPVVVPLGPRQVAAIQIDIAPYRDDPARSRYEKFAEKTYTFTLADDVPGKVVELRSELSAAGSAGAAPPDLLMAESLRFVGKR